MEYELKVPAVGESITEVLIAEWLKAPGEYAERDESVVELESDKATIELPSPVSGTITRLLKENGENANVGDIIGYIEEGPEPAKEKSEKQETPSESKPKKAKSKKETEPKVMPAAERILAEKGLKASQVEATGPGGRLLKEDVERFVQLGRQIRKEPSASQMEDLSASGSREEKRIPMTPMRKRIAERLIESQRGTASVSTFNEIDMSAVIALRKEYQQTFQDRYQVKLGFMSFFVKAVVDALKLIPQLNARVDGEDILYHNYFDIGIAVSGGKGLVVPVIRNAERMSFARIEMAIQDFATRAKANKIDLEELKGGTFTISNGGIFGSLLSTPVLNPPQSGILGLHKIQERPVVREGRVEVRPIMYVALTYDHRIVDGREGATFLVRIKEAIENPVRMLIEI